MELLKLDDNNEEITCMSNEETENISGGLNIVNDELIYELNSDEIKCLTDWGYTIEKIEDGKFKIKDRWGKVADFKRVQSICEGAKIKIKDDPLEELRMHRPRAVMKDRYF